MEQIYHRQRIHYNLTKGYERKQKLQLPIGTGYFFLPPYLQANPCALNNLQAPQRMRGAQVKPLNKN